jgi:hypothetical protein
MIRIYNVEFVVENHGRVRSALILVTHTRLKIHAPIMVSDVAIHFQVRASCAETTNEKNKNAHVGGDGTEAVKIWSLDFIFELLFQS